MGGVGHIINSLFLCDKIAKGIIGVRVSAARVSHPSEPALAICPIIVGVGNILGWIWKVNPCQAV